MSVLDTKEQVIREIVAHFLLMARSNYPTPQDAAAAFLLRLNNEGYAIVKLP